MLNKFLEKGNFGRLAAMSFASADEEHFTTAYKYFGRFLSVYVAFLFATLSYHSTGR
jgi:hypothetical protein